MKKAFLKAAEMVIKDAPASKAKKRKALAAIKAVGKSETRLRSMRDNHCKLMREGALPNSFGVKTFLSAAARGELYETQAEYLGLRIVEYFCGLYFEKGAAEAHSPVEEDTLLLLNDAGECFVYQANAGNHTKPISLAESVRLYATRLNECSESGPGEAFQDWLEAVAAGLETRGAKTNGTK